MAIPFTVTPNGGGCVNCRNWWIEGVGSAYDSLIPSEMKGEHIVRKELTDKLSIYIPQSKLQYKPVERLVKLGEKRDRSINYLVVEAIIQYLNREEKR